MKKFVYTIFCTFLLILIVIGFVSCKATLLQPDTDTKKESTSLYEPISSIDNDAQKNLDLNNLDALTRKYLDPVFWASITAKSWNSPSEIPPEDFVNFYIFSFLEKNKGIDRETYRVSVKEYEEFIKQYFDIEDSQLQQVPEYDEKMNEYSNFGYLGGGASGKVTAAEVREDRLILQYEYYSPADDVTVIRTGILNIYISDNGYKYLSCKTKEVQ